MGSELIQQWNLQLTKEFDNVRRGLRGRVLAHRGLHSLEIQENSFESFKEAAGHGLGIELDIRDSRAEIVIAHDPPSGKSLSFEKTLKELVDIGLEGNLAINVKSDGLIPEIQKLKPLLERVGHYFFDMSIPQQVMYEKAGLVTAIRVSDSDFESPVRVPHLNEKSVIWLDSFDSEWWIGDPIVKLLKSGAKVHVVSPELHGRDTEQAWLFLFEHFYNFPNLGICTDHPFEFLEGLGGDK